MRPRLTAGLPLSLAHTRMRMPRYEHIIHKFAALRYTSWWKFLQMDDAPVLLFASRGFSNARLITKVRQAFRMNAWRTFLELPNPVTGSSATEDPPPPGPLFALPSA